MLIWDDLRVLLAIADRGSVTAAARGLGVDKATVSRRISVLETALGVRLFDRKASGWTLTAAGRKALAQARRVDAAVVALQGEVAGSGPEARASVRFTAPLWFCSELLLPRLHLLRAAAPYVDLNLSARSRVADLAEREAEVGLRNVRPARGEFVVRRAGDLGSALYGARKIYGRRDMLRHDEVCAAPLVGYPDRVSYVGGFAWIDEALGDRPPALRVDDALAIAAALGSGAGLGVIPCFLGDGNPALCRVSTEWYSDPIWLVAPIDVARTRPVRQVVRFVAEAFAANADALLGARPTGS